MKRNITAAASLAAFATLALFVGVGPANAAEAGSASTESILDYVVEDAAPILATGGLKFDGTAAAGTAIDAYHPEQTPLASVIELGYDIAVAPADSQPDPAYALEVNTTGGGGYTTLSAEPYQNGQAINASGAFDVTGWKFWSSHIAASADGGQGSPESLSWFETQYPSAVVISHGIHLGTAATGTVAVVSSTSFNDVSTDFTLGTQATPIQTQAAPAAAAEVGPATVDGIDPQTGIGTQSDRYTVTTAFGTAYYNVQTKGVKDPKALTGLTAPTVVQPQGSVVATNGSFTWHETARGTVTLHSLGGGNWTIDGATATAGSAAPLADGLHTAMFTPADGHTAYPADVPTGGVRTTDGAVSFAFTLTPGTASGAAKITVAKSPWITGTAQVGKPLAANIGTIKPSSAKVRYQWLLNGVALKSGGTGKTFTPASVGYIGKKLSVKVTLALSGYNSYIGTSPQSAAVKGGTLASAVPGITGTAKVGDRLNAKPGTWTAGTTFTYQWYSNGRAIAGEHFGTLALRPAQYKTKIGLRVTGRKSGYTTLVRTSHATATVAAGTLAAGTPTIAATSSYGSAPLVGATLNAHVGHWTSGTSFRFQWYVGGSAIAGANKSAYKIPAIYVGRPFHVAVKGTKAGYTSPTKISASTKSAYNANSARVKSAVADAKSYVKYIGNTFSRTGLIRQLEFDKFSALDSAYAVDSLHINWNTAAANDAKSYMRYVGGFSYGSMVGQLEFDGFTAAQAAYGARSVHL